LFQAQRPPEAQTTFEAWCAIHLDDARAWRRELEHMLHAGKS
jgi:hypothetical protein